ncbi:MAG: NUDIX hydrolase [Oceanicaulis sp.]|uniref:NUDIX hydrolase n=1 Tax=Glycocaulis sp. TaxID=1969725 RepID=UPI0025B91AFB|nr:NUDIX hydrolase [Glycocaulis sp.]MCC5982014.1 NUDIX hydrolase [Oceanicaulis sp.]MCH8520987.1 NUDIX hydrolase [Glycocaulis sp.]
MPPAKPDFHAAIPEGDNRERRICSTCGFIDYVNPKIVAGAVVTDWEGRVLMCRRAIEPRSGFWTLPAGFMEQGESVEEAAVREAWEEARARIEITDILGVYSVPRISQVQIFFRARLMEPAISAGPESLEVGFFALDAVPEDELAFPSVRWALDDHMARLGQQRPAAALRTQTKTITPY